VAITVGSLTLDEKTTSIEEHFEAVGGKETRLIRIAGLLPGAADQEVLEASLDEILRTVSEEEPVDVSLRSGRRLQAHREEFVREINQARLTGRFALTLRAEEPYEVSDVLHQVPWSIVPSESSVSVSNTGNLTSAPVVSLTALGTIIAPRISDGPRSLSYDGVIESGGVLIVDGVGHKVWLDGVEITAYTTGAFPELSPGNTDLTYADDPASSHLLDGEVTYRDRWW
jgi:hypothetical protein